MVKMVKETIFLLGIRSIFFNVYFKDIPHSVVYIARTQHHYILSLSLPAEFLTQSKSQRKAKTPVNEKLKNI